MGCRPDRILFLIPVKAAIRQGCKAQVGVGCRIGGSGPLRVLLLGEFCPMDTDTCRTVACCRN